MKQRCLTSSQILQRSLASRGQGPLKGCTEACTGSTETRSHALHDLLCST